MKQSNSYKEFKERIQDIFNFAVLVTASVPVLKHNLKLFDKGDIKRLPDPDYFEPSVVYDIKQETLETLQANGLKQEKIEKLKLLKDIPFNNAEFKRKVIEAIGENDYKANRNIIKRQSKNYISNIRDCSFGYQKKLATYLYFSTFSYFEAFIIDISSEIINSFDSLDISESIEGYKPCQDTIGDMIKLDKTYDPRKIDRYKKFSTKIRDKGYKEPSKLIFSSMMDIYKNKVENLKANEIPIFLEKTFMFKMSKEESDTFHSIRDNRNSIGHGAKSFSPDLNDVINANKYFKALSSKIDKHLVFYFFELKNYQKE